MFGFNGVVRITSENFTSGFSYSFKNKIVKIIVFRIPIELNYDLFKGYLLVYLPPPFDAI